MNWYTIDVSKLNDDEIQTLKKQIDMLAFDIYEKLSPDFHIVQLVVFISKEYDFNKCFSLPSCCTVVKIA